MKGNKISDFLDNEAVELWGAVILPVAMILGFIVMVIVAEYTSHA